MTSDQRQAISWQNGVPVSENFADPYYSLDDGWAEGAHVFLAGNGLPDRLRPGFHVAELGFGTGLNLALLLAHWRGPGQIRYTGFEAFPLAPDTASAALSEFERARPFVPLIETLLAERHAETETAVIELVLGDARQTLPQWGGLADAWFLDGFAPARNPELWGDALMEEIARHTASNGRFATYTAAGQVRRALSAAGFEVTRRPGFGRKRHMSCGILR